MPLGVGIGATVVDNADGEGARVGSGWNYHCFQWRGEKVDIIHAALDCVYL